MALTGGQEDKDSWSDVYRVRGKEKMRGSPTPLTPHTAHTSGYGSGQVSGWH